MLEDMRKEGEEEKEVIYIITLEIFEYKSNSLAVNVS